MYYFRLWYFVFFVFFGVVPCQAFEVDLENRTFYSHSLDINAELIISRYGAPVELSKVSADYYSQHGFYLLFNPNTKMMTEYNFYLSDWNPITPSKTPKNNKAFKGNFSYGIKGGAKFSDVIANVKDNFKRKFSAYGGRGCIYYGSCSESGKVIILDTDDGWITKVIFDENDEALSVSIDKRRDISIIGGMTKLY